MSFERPYLSGPLNLAGGGYAFFPLAWPGNNYCNGTRIRIFSSWVGLANENQTCGRFVKGWIGFTYEFVLKVDMLSVSHH